MLVNTKVAGMRAGFWHRTLPFRPGVLTPGRSEPDGGAVVLVSEEHPQAFGNVNTSLLRPDSCEDFIGNSPLRGLFCLAYHLRFHNRNALPMQQFLEQKVVHPCQFCRPAQADLFCYV